MINAFLNLFANKSYNISRFVSKQFENEIIRILCNNEYDLILLETLYTTPYINIIKVLTKSKIVLRSHNVEFEIWSNLAKNTSNIFRKWYLKLLAKRLKIYELETIKQVDLIAAISESDMKSFQSVGCKTPMVYLPFGINFSTQEFKNYELPKEEQLVLFHIGSMEWIPHQEAFKWFFEKVWKKITEKNIGIQLHLAGTNMPKWIINGKYSNVIIMDGYAEAKNFMFDKSIMIVPSISGSGIRIKIIEGMAKGKVILTTENGIMRIPALHDEHVFISNNPNEWVSIITKLFHDIDLVRKMSFNSRMFCENEFNYKKIAIEFINQL
jgi:polysaccharide biosynthesis protein PslH